MELTSQLGMALRQQRTLAMTAQLRQAIGLLKYNNAELSAHLARLAAANSAICLLPEQPNRMAEQQDAGKSPRGTASVSGGGTDVTEATLAQPDGSLHDHVRAQIGMSFRTARERTIAEAFCDALEPSGWLRDPVAEVARRIRCDPAEAEAVLAKLQQLEPAGLFARNLAECLRLQAADQGLLSVRMGTVLDHLDLLARGALDALSRLCACSEEEVRRTVAQLRCFNPKPGAAFGSVAAPVRPPDLIVTPAGPGSWQVDLNHATTPRVVVREEAAEALSDPDARHEALTEARWLERAVSRRNATTLKIAAAVVQRQSGFLHGGPAALRPLTFADVAAATGVHESTVSRITAGLMVATPGGTISLRDLFSGALPTGEGAETVAAGAVRHAIRRMIAAEDPARPLSDEVIARRLQEDAGTRVARRTVAKYRDMMRIPGSSTRRARARMAAGG